VGGYDALLLFDNAVPFASLKTFLPNEHKHCSIDCRGLRLVPLSVLRCSFCVSVCSANSSPIATSPLCSQLPSFPSRARGCCFSRAPDPPSHPGRSTRRRRTMNEEKERCTRRGSLFLLAAAVVPCCRAAHVAPCRLGSRCWYKRRTARALKRLSAEWIAHEWRALCPLGADL